MGQLDQTRLCPHCGAQMVCLDCERPDPIESPQAMGWLAGELGRIQSCGKSR
jgi:hypothetical protein